MPNHQLDILPLLIPIQKDVDLFLQRFSKQKSSHCRSFETFKSIWDDMHLHLIYSCQTIEELFVFQELLLDVVKNRLLPPYPSVWQLGAVYLLFAFTELVPYKRHLSVIQPRLTLDDLKGIQKLLRYLRVEEELDAITIFMYTLRNHCLIVAHPMSELYIDLRKQYSHRISSQPEQLHLKSAATVASCSLRDLTPEAYIAEQLESFGFLKKMTATNNQYCALKSLMPDVRDSSLCSLIGRNLIPNFFNSTSEAIQQNQSTSQHSTLAERKSNPTEEDIGGKRYRLKYKSFAKDCSTIRGGSRLQDTIPEDQAVRKVKQKAPASAEDCNMPYAQPRGSKVPILENISTLKKTQRYRNSNKQKRQLRSCSGKRDFLIKQMGKKIKPDRDGEI